MRKRGVALFVAALMIAALAFPVGANVNPFSDLRSDHWAYEAIVKLAAAGLVEGYPDGTFGGDRTFTRYEMAMVFARILARFEGLIDDKIGEGIDAKAQQLALEIEAVRKALADRIDANYEDLLARLRALELELGDVSASLDAHLAEEPHERIVETVVERVETVAQPAEPAPVEVVSAELTDEARAALAEQLMDEMLDQLRILLKEDLDDLARRVRNLERSALTDRDVERIARQVVADALAAQTAEIEAAEANAIATARLVDNRVDDLENALAAMALEFRGELAQLGVKVNVLDARVDRIEQKVDRQGDQIADLMARLGNVAFSGTNKTRYQHTAVDGPLGEVLVDPRDGDSEKLKGGVLFDNTYTLVVTATPADNVEVKASLVGINRLGEVESEFDKLTLMANLEVTTPGVLRSLHVGELDKDEIVAPFSKYVLFKDEFKHPVTHPLTGEEQDWRGAHVDLVWGQDDSTNLHGFISRTHLGENTLGAHASYKLSDAFDLAFSGVRRLSSFDTGGWMDYEDSVYSVESKGTLETLDYSVFYSTFTDGVDSANVIEARANLPVSIATASFEYGRVDEGYAPLFAKNLDSGKDMVAAGRDWLERHLTPAADWLEQGESAYTATLSAPIHGIPVSASFGRLETEDGFGGDSINNFTRAEVGSVHWAGIDASLLYDRRVDQFDAVDNTLRASFDTTILGANVSATVHNRTNNQVWDGAEAEQRHTWVTATHQVDLLLPLKLEGRYGTSQTSGIGNHTYFGVSVDKYPVGPFALSAGYSMSNNDVDAGKWWINDKWSSDKVDTMTFGVDYTLREFFGTDVQTGYEYKLIRVNDAVDGSARNTFRASFDKELRGGEAKLAGEGKLVTGGSSKDRTTGTDLTAKLTLTYPVFAGGDLILGGTYVSSTGDPIEPEYTAYQLKAGLEFGF